MLHHSDHPGEGLVDDKKNRASDSGDGSDDGDSFNGPDGGSQDGDTGTVQAVSPTGGKTVA